MCALDVTGIHLGRTIGFDRDRTAEKPFERGFAIRWRVQPLEPADSIAVLTAVLLARSDFAAFRWMALAAVLMPLGDAWLTASAGAGAPVIGRHLASAVFLLVASHFLACAARGKAST